MDTVLEQKGNLLSRLTASVRRVLGPGAADRRQKDPAIRGNQQLFSSHAAHEFDSWTPLLVANAVIASGFAAVAAHYGTMAALIASNLSLWETIFPASWDDRP
mgnify:CR=1 FL=1